jgi:hypothetical protein
VSEKGHTQTDDHGQHLDGPGSNVSIRLIGMDRPFFSALAVVLALAAMVLAFFAMTQADRTDAKAVYWLQRDESFLEELANQGYKVPPDLLHRDNRPNR